MLKRFASTSILSAILLLGSSASEASDDKFLRVVKAFENKLILPPGAMKIKNYARYYSKSNVYQNDKIPITIVKFKFIGKNDRPGLYIVSDIGAIRGAVFDDGGCIFINGIFNFETEKLLYIECAPER